MPYPGMAIATWVWRSGLTLQGGGSSEETLRISQVGVVNNSGHQ